MEMTSALFCAGVVLSASTLASCKSTTHISIEEVREIDLNFERPTYLVPDRSNQVLLSKVNSYIEIENFYQTEILKKECAEIEQRIVHQTADEVEKNSKQAWSTSSRQGKEYSFAFMRKRLFGLGYFEESESMIDPKYVGPIGGGWEHNKAIMYSMRSTLSAWRKDFSAAFHWNSQALENIRIFKTRGVRYGWERDAKNILNVQDLLTKAELAQIKGNYLKAEGLYREAVIRGKSLFTNDPARTSELPISLVQSRLAENLLAQNKLHAAEAEIQETLKHPDKATTPVKSIMVTTLAQVLFEQGRFREAEEIAQAAIRLFDSACAPHRTFYFARARSVLGNALLSQGMMQAAREQFDLIEQEHGSAYPDSFNHNFAGNLDWGIALIDSGELARGLIQVQKAYERLIQGYSVNSLDAAIARGYLGIAQFANDNRQSAEEAFKIAIPKLIDNYLGLARTSQKSLKGQRIRRVLEGYLAFLAIDPDTNTITASSTHISEMFEIADLARSGKVHQAVAAAITRAVSDPDLAELIRLDQDASLTEEALLLLIAKLSGESSDKARDLIEDTRENLRSVQSVREKFSAEIESRFPEYTERLRISAVNVNEVRRVLKDNEALIASYIGSKKSYVWAIPKQGDVAFAVLPYGRAEISEQVNHLRESLDPGVSMLDEIPPFDVNAAHNLYRLLLEPVKQGWDKAKELVVVSHGPLGQLPLGILPTQPLAHGSVLCDDKQWQTSTSARTKHSTRALQRSDSIGNSQSADPCRASISSTGETAGVQSEISSDILFSEYRKVAWLARSHAVSVIPSISTFREQRVNQSLTRTTRPFIGFGDPLFSPDELTSEVQQFAQVDEISLLSRGVQFRSPVVTRSMSSATLADLPRLPETADEVIAIAESLGANPEKDVFLGIDASEKNIYSQALDHYRVIAFATHGLVPGDLNGLQQPALAFTHPSLSNTKGDGLMKLEEVLQLDLDADWVILSACNTGAADGAGSEAISGLGRAFFYAGARSLLVTHWPVETSSAKALTTKIFETQSESPGISRSNALRHARLAAMDGPGYIDDRGREIFSYAHPIFWAPFALIGSP
jgi:CHAT domain-containing protein